MRKKLLLHEDAIKIMSFAEWVLELEIFSFRKGEMNKRHNSHCQILEGCHSKEELDLSVNAKKEVGWRKVGNSTNKF